MLFRLIFFAIMCLLLAGPIVQAQFLPYHEFRFKKQPSSAHFDSLGLRPSHGVYEHEVTGGSPPVKESLMRARARSTFQQRVLHENRMWFDIEYLITDELRVGRDQAVANAETLAKYIGWAKDAEPRLQVGLYSMIPVTDLYISTRLSQRQAANDAIQLLADKLDFICPSTYLFYSEQTKPYASYAVPMVAEAKRLAKGKKVIAFVAPGYHPSGEYPHQYASYDVWKNVLHVIKDSAKADGFMLFAGLNALGEQYSDWASVDTSGWWRATKEFLASLRLDKGLVPPPSLLAPDPAIFVDPSAFTVRWRNAVGAVSYHLQLADNDSFQFPLVDDSTLTDSTRHVIGLQDNTTYYVRLRAKSVFSWWGEFSSTVQFATATPPPAPPALIAPAPGTVVTTSTITVRWSKVHGALQYHLQLFESPSFRNPLVNDSTLTDTVRRVDGLRSATNYFVRFRVRGSPLWSVFSNPLQFSTARILLSVVTTESPMQSYLAQNYPNPFNPITTIRFALRQDSDVRLEVYNTLGELVRQLLNSYVGAGVYDLRFDASTLPSGVYICRIRTADLVDSKRLLLIK